MNRAIHRQPLFRTSAAIAIGGALLSIAGAIVAPEIAATSYLVAYTATTATVVGVLILIMIAQATGATWFVLFRRPAEAIVGALPMLAILTLPFIAVPHAFWPWAAPFDVLPRSIQEAVQSKQTYLQPWFFVARTALYWAVWLCAGEMLRSISRRQDAGHPDASRRFNVVSIAALPLVSAALPFAAVDWMMSLSPGWSSSVYGVYYATGAVVSAFGLLASIAFVQRRTGSLTAEHLHALGKLMLAFVLFWGYIWYSQFFIVWIAGIPRETDWYEGRLHDGWRIVAASILAGGFVVPLFVLLVRVAKRSFPVMGLLGVWLLAVHYLDVYWLIVPDRQGAWSIIHLLWDAGTLAAVAGSAATAALWRQEEAPRVPIGDPLFGASLHYESR